MKARAAPQEKRDKGRGRIVELPLQPEEGEDEGELSTHDTENPELMEEQQTDAATRATMEEEEESLVLRNFSTSSGRSNA